MPLSLRVEKSVIVAAFVAFLSLARAVEGQVTAGTPNWSAYDSGQYDTINLQNLNVLLNVPVMSKSGAFPFNASLGGGDSYFSYNGTLQPGILAQPITPIVNGILSPFGYTKVLASTTSSVTCPSGDGTGSATKYSGWFLLMTDGTVHSLPSTDVAYGGTSCSSTLTDQVIDGTGWTVTIVGGTYNSWTQAGVTVVSSGGLNVEIATATIQDAQSTPSKIYYNAQEFFDTLGTHVLTVNPDAAGQLRWFDVNGGWPTESQTFTIPTLKTSFGCTGKADYPATSYDTGLTTAVSFPDGTSIGLAWEPNQVTSTDFTGRLQKITLRGGGTITYNWNAAGASSPPYGLNCTYLVPASVSRTTSDGTVTYNWAPALISGSNYKSTTTKLDIEQNKTMYTFTGLTSTGLAAFPIIQALTQVQYFSNTGTIASPTYSSTADKTVIYRYNSSSPTTANCPTATVTVPITEVDTFTAFSGQGANYARQQTQYDGGPSGSCGTGSGSCYGNVTYSAQYDYGASSPRYATTTTYGSWNGSTCVAVGNGINNKVCTTVTKQGSSVVADSEFTYDPYGNLWKTYISPNGGTSFLSNATNNSYNGNGTPSVTYDLANNSTTYTSVAAGTPMGTAELRQTILFPQ